MSTPINVSSGERADRVRELHCMTQSEYNKLLAIVITVVGTQFCDPADALSHGLLIALQKFDGRGPLLSYVVRCASLYALQQMKKNRRLLNFSDLQTDEDFEDFLDQALPFLEDPRYVEGIDDLFIRRIEEILEGMHNWRFWFSTRQAINDAMQILALFRDNANLGTGVGIDEYEYTPPAIKQRPGKPTHNSKLVRRMIADRLSEELQTDKRNIFSALRALRLSTRQALNEGWLPS